MLEGESLKRLLQGAAAGAVARSLLAFTGVAGRSAAPLIRWQKSGGARGHSGAGTRVRRQIPRTTGRRGEASRAFEGRLVEASGRIPQGVRDPPG